MAEAAAKSTASQAGSDLAKQKQDQQNNNHEAEAAAAVSYSSTCPIRSALVMSKA
jgi:hypothetical protein